MTPVQAKLLAAIREHTRDGVAPKYETLASAMGWASRSNVLRVLIPMRKAGLVDWDARRANSLRILTDGPSRAAMERWSDDEVRRVSLAVHEISRDRGLNRLFVKGRAAA